MAGDDFDMLGPVNRGYVVWALCRKIKDLNTLHKSIVARVKEART